MDKRLIDILACPACHGELRFSGESDDRRLISGKFKCSGCGLVFPVEDEIAMLVPPGVNYDGALWDKMEDIDKQMAEWVQRNFESELKRMQPPLAQEFIKEVSAVEGPMIDIASGPGGSWCVDVMKDGDTNRLLVMSDIGRPVMKAWQRQLRDVGWADRCSLMVFDARRMPFRDASIAAVTSVVGGVNDVDMAYKEAGRVLRPCGQLLEVVKFFKEGGPTQQARKEYGEAVTTWSEYAALLTGLSLRIERSELYYSGRGKSDPADEVPLDDNETWECRMVYAAKNA